MKLLAPFKALWSWFLGLFRRKAKAVEPPATSPATDPLAGLRAFTPPAVPPVVEPSPVVTAPDLSERYARRLRYALTGVPALAAHPALVSPPPAIS